MKRTLIVCALLAAACTPPAQTDTSTTATTAAAPEVPAEAMALIQAAMPGFTPTSAAFENGGDGEYEVAGTDAQGAAYEFDMMHSSAGWSIIEIERDVEWASVPQSVRDAAAAAPNAFTPVRVIEGRQPVDNSIIYDLFAEGAQPGHPTMSVRLLDGEAAVMPPPH